MMGDLPSRIGAYRVVRSLGEGGMGCVYEAVHEAIERRVAIKVLHPEYARNTEFTARFFNEARAVNRVEHPGLVQVSDYGQQADGTAFIVMEYLKGQSLASRVERSGGKLPPAEVIHYSWQIADSLAAAHAKDIVHRDLKPENVMLVPEPHMPGGERTKLLDFGIAKVVDQGTKPRVQTKTDQFMGTPMYMSPEQCEGAGRVDAKSDVYSIGVMMFEMLSGKLPFIADGPGKLLAMHLYVEPPVLKEIAPHVPEALADLVQKLLIKDREQRPSMAEVVTTLAALAEKYPLPRPADSAHHAAMAAPPIDGLKSTLAQAGKSTLGASASQIASLPRTRSRWRRLALLSALFFVLLVVGSVALLVKVAPMAMRLRQSYDYVLHGGPAPSAATTQTPASTGGPAALPPTGSTAPSAPGPQPPPPSTEAQLMRDGQALPPLQNGEAAPAPGAQNPTGETQAAAGQSGASTKVASNKPTAAKKNVRHFKRGKYIRFWKVRIRRRR
jgi:serine/threonine protein kinase